MFATSSFTNVQFAKALHGLTGYSHYRNMRAIFARASARYSGRIDAELSTCDVCILIRDYEGGGDGSVMLLGNKGVLPINWMPGGSTIHEESSLIRVTKGTECLEIFIDSIHDVMPMNVELAGQLVKLGAEREFSDRLSERLELLPYNMKLVAREYRTNAGPIDILATDPDQLPVVIEVKRRRVTLGDVFQVIRYMRAIRDDHVYPKRLPRALIVGPVLANNAKEMLKREKNIEFVRLSFDQVTD